MLKKIQEIATEANYKEIVNEIEEYAKLGYFKIIIHLPQVFMPTIEKLRKEGFICTLNGDSYSISWETNECA